MLEGLPKEVYWMVLNQVSDRRAFTQLCAVSKTLYELTLPKLYETVVISSESEKNLERINTKSFLIGNSTARLHYTKHVRISAPFHENLDERCIHFRDIDDQIKHNFDEELEEREAGGRTKFRKLEATTLTFLEQLKDESLKSFSWELGTCIPREILGSEGYLPCEQTSLEAITLITGIGCPDETDGWNAVDLSQFCALRRISWIGMQTDPYLQALRDALQKNSKHLTHLRLEHVPQDGDSDGSDGSDGSNDGDEKSGDRRAYCRNLFARECLGLVQSNATTEAIFPALTSLSLGSIPLKNAETALVNALNIRKLSHLTLRQCPSME
ncbi:hypothetical protein BKA64DRAFT_647968 [Cadophora sp. MPI-SDFR-AT-0126]|nr:hypothetical protein BKA64DRAFT_647968 [Leotiomycetes sp. MPI-SDFR-AT-0126]